MELGLGLVGITDASPIDAEQTAVFAGWLRSGYAGQMGYMQRNLEKRTNPTKLMEDAQSVICVGLNYRPPTLRTRAQDPDVSTGAIADYALYDDYHPFMKERLRGLVDFLGERAGGDLKFRICVDSTPVAERALAARAGLGFIGKNRMLINPKLGPQIFLGEIITNLKLNRDKPITGDCSGCTNCIRACPAGALRADGRFDASRCISYLTIEHKGGIPPELAPQIGNRLFGCDECIHVCPYGRKAPTCKNQYLKFHPDREQISLHEILNMTPELFEARFANSVIKRCGLERLKRNARICLANISAPAT